MHRQCSRLIVALACYACISVTALSAQAQVTKMELSVRGLACPFCVHGIRKKVTAVDGVQQVVVSLEGGLVTITPEPGGPPSPKALRDAITESGFTAGDLTVTIIGSLSVSGTRSSLRVQGSDQDYLLFRPPSEPHTPLTREARNHLAELSARGTLVTITGLLHDHDELPPGLSVSAVEPASR